jgi:transposase
VSRPTVSLWRTRFVSRGINGLRNELKPGRPRSTSEEKVAQLINTALKRKPEGKTRWSRQGLAAETGLSKTTVHRYLTLFGLPPHRTRSFKLSTDPFFIEKVRDIVGLYLNPPDHALVLCVWMRSPRCRRSSAPSPCCRWGSGTWRASRTITSAMERLYRPRFPGQLSECIQAAAFSASHSRRTAAGERWP